MKWQAIMAVPKQVEQPFSRREYVAAPPDAGLYGVAALMAMFGIMAVVLLAALDQTIVGTALPRVVSELGGFDLYAWVGTSYLLTSTIMVPIVGKLGDLYGRKPFLLASIVVFVGASALAGMAQSMLWLIAARGIQGIGAGMLQATAFTSVSDMFPQPERRARWQGLITSTFAIASVVGPVLGGVMTDTLGWRSVFYINLPIGILALTLIWFTLPANLSPRTQHARIDWAGAATIALAISALLLMVEWGGSEYSWTSPAILSLAALSVAATVMFVRIERNAPEPVLPLDLFRDPTIRLISVISLLLGFLMFALVYYTPLLFQGGLGMSPSLAGAYQTPLAVSMAFGSLVSGQIFARTRQMKVLMRTGTLLLLSGTALLLWDKVQSIPLALSIVLAIAGMGAGMNFPMLTLMMQTIVPRDRLGVGTSTTQFTRLIGSTIGTAIVGAVVNAIFARQLAAAMAPNIDVRLAEALHNPQALIDPRAQASLQQLAEQLGSAGALQVQQMIDVARNALMAGVHAGYVMALCAAILMAVLVQMIRTPNFRASTRTIPVKVEETAEAL
jgi:EmrB/QacA subfamily drug resistance transporter